MDVTKKESIDANRSSPSSPTNTEQTSSSSSPLAPFPSPIFRPPPFAFPMFNPVMYSRHMMRFPGVPPFSFPTPMQQISVDGYASLPLPSMSASVESIFPQTVPLDFFFDVLFHQSVRALKGKVNTETSNRLLLAIFGENKQKLEVKWLAHYRSYYMTKTALTEAEPQHKINENAPPSLQSLFVGRLSFQWIAIPYPCLHSSVACQMRGFVGHNTRYNRLWMSKSDSASEYEIQYRSTIQPRTAVRSQSRQSGNYVSGGTGTGGGGE
uniref:Uncharacterized protein n=1 Tax=Heterorhabditis bacteriophora TaxID=37862 RepID=A0A1I7WBN3_HETBA